jgi:hypothetical protein
MPRPNDLSPTYMWHYCLGHISENCMKMTKAPFMGIPERALDLLEHIHTDVCGPMSTTTRGGFQYFITLTDDFSRYGYVHLMKHKSEFLEKFNEF